MYRLRGFFVGSPATLPGISPGFPPVRLELAVIVHLVLVSSSDSPMSIALKFCLLHVCSGSNPGDCTQTGFIALRPPFVSFGFAWPLLYLRGVSDPLAAGKRD